MATEVEQACGNVQKCVTPPSTACITGAKTSIFGKKSGFVIPKNKLSGSLVPAARATTKGDAELVDGETSNRVQRKTKWGPDLTLDTTVRKQRVSAYQTRINQIENQLTLGTLDIDGYQDSLSASEIQDEKRSDRKISNEDMVQLELERREIIGEILKLNPAYKAPAYYKPLLKEAKVTVPIKEYPGYNFIGLLFGPATATLKQLEKDTGAKIRVYGTRADTGGKVEVSPSDGKETEKDYKELYVHVSADTFEKVDSVVALIELLVTPVSVNPVSSTTSTAVSAVTPSSLVNQDSPQPFVGSSPSPLGNFPQYPQTWFPTKSSAPLSTADNLQVPSSLYNPSNMSFAPRPVTAASFSPVLRNPSVFPYGPQLSPISQPTHMQQALPPGQAGGPRNAVLQSRTAHLATGSSSHYARPDISLLPQPTSQAPYSDNTVLSASQQGLGNKIPVTLPADEHNANMVFSGPPPPVTISNNVVSPISGPTLSAVAVASQYSRGGIPPVFTSAASEFRSLSIQPDSAGPGQPGMPRGAMHLASSSTNVLPGGPAPPGPFMMQPPASLHQRRIGNSISGNAPSFDPMGPLSAAMPRPQQQPCFNDFTFQPHRPSSAAASSHTAWQSSQPAHFHQGHGPLAPPLRHNLNPSPAQDFPRAQLPHQINQPWMPQNPAPSFGGRNPDIPPLRQPTLPHMQPSFLPPRPMNNTFSSGPYPTHNQQAHPRGPQIFPLPHPNLGNHPGRPFPNNTQQVYDPFSPTSASFNPRMMGGSGNTTNLHRESDPEYEDLMASVGVK